MERLAASIATASALFVGTNLDDLVVLAVLNVSSRADGRPKARHIWIGQYLGAAVLVGVSLLAALGLTILPDNRTWLLGLLPLGLGLYKLVVRGRAPATGAKTSPTVGAGLVGVAIVTIANGGDNIAAYTPFFRTSRIGDIAVTIAVFALGVALWCASGAWLVSHRRVTPFIERWGHWLVPTVFVALGTYIVCKAGVRGH